MYTALLDLTDKTSKSFCGLPVFNMFVVYRFINERKRLVRVGKVPSILSCELQVAPDEREREMYPGIIVRLQPRFSSTVSLEL